MVDRHNDGLPMGIASLEDKFKVVNNTIFNSKILF